jgi:hypothetical protein
MVAHPGRVILLVMGKDYLSRRGAESETIIDWPIHGNYQTEYPPNSPRAGKNLVSGLVDTLVHHDSESKRSPIGIEVGYRKHYRTLFAAHQSPIRLVERHPSRRLGADRNHALDVDRR